MQQRYHGSVIFSSQNAAETFPGPAWRLQIPQMYLGEGTPDRKGHATGGKERGKEKELGKGERGYCVSHWVPVST